MFTRTHIASLIYLVAFHIRSYTSGAAVLLRGLSDYARVDHLIPIVCNLERFSPFMQNLYNRRCIEIMHTHEHTYT